MTPDPLRNARSLLLRTTMDQGSSLAKLLVNSKNYEAFTYKLDPGTELELFYFGIFHPNQFSDPGSSLIEPNVLDDQI